MIARILLKKSSFFKKTAPFGFRLYETVLRLYHFLINYCQNLLGKF